MRNLCALAFVVGAAATLAVPSHVLAVSVEVDLRPVATGLPLSTVVANAGDGSGRLFVALRAGTIRVVRDGQVLVQPFLDLTGQVSTGHSDQGLLGLAFHPEYARNGLFFVTYTDPVGASVISRFAVDPSDPDRGDPTSEEILLVIPQPHGAHNGGQLAFGPDGYLYIGDGDGGRGGDPRQQRGQNLEHAASARSCASTSTARPALRRHRPPTPSSG